MNDLATNQSVLRSTSLFGLAGEPAHELVAFVTDEGSALRAVIAIHSTALGPAFGGCRLWHYVDDEAAFADALRLSQGMSMKNALAGLPFGGGKAVVLRPPGAFDRARLFTAFGRAVQSLFGRYITAEDVGTTTDDMLRVRDATSFVSGVPRAETFGGDPSPKTAYGVFVAIEEAVSQHLQRSLVGATVAIQGVGAVGGALAHYLHEAGARLVMADTDEARARRIAIETGGSVVSVDDIMFQPVDVLAPCALGAVLGAATIPRLQASIVAGAANNQLATPEDGDRLHSRGVLYLPDYLINAGGIISVAREYLGQGAEDDVMREVGLIRDRVATLLSKAGRRPNSRVADEWARQVLSVAREPQQSAA